MTQFLARDWMVAVLLFSGIAGLFFLAITSMATDYDETQYIDANFQENYDQLSDATSDVDSALDAASSKDGLTVVGTVEVLFKSSNTIFSLIFGSLGTAKSQVGSFMEDAGVPGPVYRVFAPLILAILTIIIVMIVISSVTRRDL